MRSQPGRALLKALAMLVFLVIISGAFLKLVEDPFPWIGAAWAAGLAFLAGTSRGGLRIVWVNLGLLTFLLGMVEFILVIASRRNRGTESPRYVELGERWIVDDSLLGFRPKPNVRSRAVKLHGNDSLYDVMYTIGPSGLRITPPGIPGGSTHCLLFFGDSFTFGEGVQDSQTLPFLVAELSGARTYNFGFSGYGPHQMLAALEGGLVDSRIDCRPTFAVYQALPTGHVIRAAGHASWDRNGPRYVLSDSGVGRSGRFADPPESLLPRILERLGAQLRRSHLWRKFRPPFQITSADVDLGARIIAASRDELVNRFEFLSFHVIVWSDSLFGERGKVLEERFLTGLAEQGISIHLVTDIVPDISIHWSDYTISPVDPHPNVKANRVIAGFIVNRIMNGATVAGHAGQSR
jgi:hypothetical protein